MVDSSMVSGPSLSALSPSSSSSSSEEEEDEDAEEEEPSEDEERLSSSLSALRASSKKKKKRRYLASLLPLMKVNRNKDVVIRLQVVIYHQTPFHFPLLPHRPTHKKRL